jgi:hypothetical protein
MAQMANLYGLLDAVDREKRFLVRRMLYCGIADQGIQAIDARHTR